MEIGCSNRTSEHKYIYAFCCVQVTLQINEEVHEQNRALDQMQTGMGAGDDLLSASLKKMGVIAPAYAMRMRGICRIAPVFIVFQHATGWMMKSTSLGCASRCDCLKSLIPKDVNTSIYGRPLGCRMFSQLAEQAQSLNALGSSWEYFLS